MITNLYQANLNSGQVLGRWDAVVKRYGREFLHFVAGFGETVIASSSGGGTVTNSFSVNSGRLLQDVRPGALGNNFAGTGFSCAGNGILTVRS